MGLWKPSSLGFNCEYKSFYDRNDLPSGKRSDEGEGRHREADFHGRCGFIISSRDRVGSLVSRKHASPSPHPLFARRHRPHHSPHTPTRLPTPSPPSSPQTSVYHWAKLSDKLGRKPVIMMGLAGVAISSALYGYSTKFWQLIVTRSLSGALNGNVAVSRSEVVFFGG